METLPKKKDAEARALAHRHALKEFVKWVIQESWENYDVCSQDIQNKAVKFGLLEEVSYNPEKHGPNEYDSEPVDEWFVFVTELRN